MSGNASGAALDRFRVQVYSSFEQARPVWSALQKDACCYGFQSFEWLSSWHRFIGSQSAVKLAICVVSGPDDTPMMLLPLGVSAGGPCSTLHWLGGTVTDYQGPILSDGFTDAVSPADFPDLWRLIRRHLPPHHLVKLEKQPEALPGQSNPFLALPCIAHASSAHFMALDASADALLERKRSSKTRSTEKRKERRLRERGTLRFAVVGPGDAQTSILEAMMAQKSRAYNELGVEDLFADPAYKQFVAHMTREHAGGLVHLSALLLDDDVIASHWGMVHDGRFYFLFPTYVRNALTRFSPGNVLLVNLFGWAIEQGLDVFDFTVGDESYKYSWADGELRLHDHVAAASLYGVPFALAERLRRRLKRGIKQSPRLFALAKRVRTALSPSRYAN